MTPLRAAAALAAAAAALWLGRLLLKIARAGSGYKAKIACAALHVSGLDLDVNAAPEVSAEAYLALRLFRARRLDQRKAVTASLLGLGRRTAVWRPGAGTTLTSGTESAVTIPAAAPSTPLRRAARPPAALEAVLEEAFRELDPARVLRTRAVVVLKDGELAGERYAPGFSPETLLPGWSMTKSVVGALSGVAVGRGLARLDGRALLPEWTGGRAGISFEDLLRMRSGLRFAEKYANPASDVVQMLFARDDAAGYAASRPLAHAPGTRWQYSSGTTNIVSLLLRRALGDAEYHAFPRRALFDKIGMESAVFETDAAGTFVGSSFMFATARDWARFGQLCLQDGVWEGERVLPEGWMRFCASPTPQAPPGLYGAHWWLKLQEAVGGGTPEAERLPADAFHALGHEGQCLTVIPSRGLVAVRLGLSIRVDAWNHAAFLTRLLDALG